MLPATLCEQGTIDAAAELRLAAELHRLGVEMTRTRLRRGKPDLDDGELDRQVAAWLSAHPPPGLGDDDLRPVSWPRDRA